jgi:hypothetical protein
VYKRKRQRKLVRMPVSKAMYGVTKSGMVAFERNFDAPARIALPNL